MDKQNLEDYLELLHHFSQVALSGEISHSINNVLTSLTIQQSMLSMALQKGDIEKATDRAKTIGEAAKRLETYAVELSTANHLSPTPEESKINSLIEDTLEFSHWLPSLSGCQITRDLTEECDLFTVDPQSIKILILSFLKTTCSLFLTPEVTIQTRREGELFKIQALARDRDPKTASAGPKFPRELGSGLGVLPFQSVKRIIQLLNKNVELEPVEEDGIGFNCTIFPQG